MKPIRYMDFFNAIQQRRGWKQQSAANGPSGFRVTAQRTFKYPHHSATVWIEATTRGQAVRNIEAHVSVPFTAGPEESYAPHPRTGSLVGVMEWIAQKERALSVPLRLSGMRTYDAAHRALSGVKARDLWTLAYVFDIDWERDDSVIRHRIIGACAPQLLTRHL